MSRFDFLENLLEPECRKYEDDCDTCPFKKECDEYMRIVTEEEACKYIKNLILEKQETDSFKYMLLSRMRSDCDYYLGNGNRLKKFLWSNNEREHIANMKALWNSFPADEKPEWLTMEQIEEYEKEMLKY